MAGEGGVVWKSVREAGLRGVGTRVRAPDRDFGM